MPSLLLVMPAGHLAKVVRRAVEANAKNDPCTPRQIVETAIRGHNKIHRIRDAGREGRGRFRLPDQIVDPTGTELRIEILADVIGRKIYRGRVIEGSSGYRAPGCRAVAMTILK